MKEIFRHLTGGHKESAALRELKDGVYHYMEGLQELWDAGFDEILAKDTTRQQRGHAGEVTDEESPVGKHAMGKHAAQDGEGEYSSYYGKHAPAMEVEGSAGDATEMVPAAEEVPESFTGTLEEYRQYMADIEEDSKNLNSEETKERLRDYQEHGVKNSDRDQDYFDNIAQHDDIQVVQVPKVNVPRYANGGIDKAQILTTVRNNPLVDTVDGRYVTFCDDIDGYVELNAEGIKHGFGTYASQNKNVVPTQAAQRNARAAMLLPELLQNAVEVNRSNKYSGNGLDYGHVLMAVYAETDNAGNTEYYAARIVVEHNSTKESYDLVEFGVVGQLHAVNAKKMQPSQGSHSGVAVTTTSASSIASAYSIADLITDVKDEFGDTFSVGAYQKTGLTRKNTDFSKYLMYSERDLPESISIREYLAAALDERGIPYTTYDGSDADRLEKANAVEGVRFSDRDVDVSYDALVNKPDMQLTVLTDDIGSRDRAAIINAGYENAKENGVIGKSGMPAIYVEDIGRNVHVSKNSLKHGLDRRADAMSTSVQHAGELLKNAILINTAEPKKAEATDSYILLSAGKEVDGNVIMVSFVVNSFTDEVESFDVLYSMKTKKNQPRQNAELGDESLRSPGSTISIADLLDYGKNYFSDVLSKDVLNHFGTERKETEITQYLRYSERDTTDQTETEAFKRWFGAR